jgi:hypothetical protein
VVQQISALIVQPAVDATKYTAGAQEKVAADRAMAASSREAGAAQQGLSVVLTDTSAKISTTGDVVTRLERTYVAGAKQALMFERDLNALNRALETGKLDTANAADVLVGMNQKLGLSADASSIAASGQTKLAAAINIANDRIRQQTTLLNDVAIAEARAAQNAENQRQAAAANQNRFNQVLGVGSPSISASTSASVFQAEFDRLDQIAVQKAQQIGRNFAADLDASLSTGISKAARDSALIFQAEFARLDEIASLKAQQAGSIFQSDLNSSFRIGSSGKSAGTSASVFEAAARETEMYEQKARDLREALGDVSIMQDRLNAELGEYAVLAERGLITSEHLAKAQQMARTRASRGVSSRASQAAGFNAGQQVQDIAMMSLLGQAPLTVGLQQGPQLATAIQQGGGLSALGAGLASVFSTTTLLTVGITAASAATIQWFMKGTDGAKGMADAISKSDDAVRSLADAYKLADFNADELGKKTVVAAEAQERMSRRELERQLRQSGRTIQGATTPSDYMTFGIVGRGQNYTVDPRFAAFSGPVLELRKALSEGKADFATLERIQNEIEAIADKGYGPFRSFVDDMARMVGMEPEGIRETADALQDVITKAAETARRLEQLQNLNRDGRSDRVVGPNRMDAAEDAGRRILEAQRRERELKFLTEEEQFQAGLQQQRARTNAERLAAAERSARAAGGDTNSDVRVRRALAEERTRQEVEARDATIQRSQAIQRTLDQQRLELDLVGKTTVEQAKQRFEFERMQELREQAARTGDPIDQKEVDKIKAAADAMGQYADALARAKLGDDIQFEREQLFRAPGEQQIASRLRGTGLGMNSAEAQALRENQQIEQISNATDAFVTTFQSTLVSSGGDIGKSFSKAFRDAMLTELADVGKQAMQNLASVLTKGIASALGIGGSVSSGGVAAIAGAANDNLAAPIGTVIRSALPNIGSGSSYSVANATDFIKQYSSAIGIDPDIALRVARSEGLGNGIWQSNAVSNGIREPSFGPFQLLKGGKGTGFGTGLGNKFMAQTGLDPADPANWQQSTAFALDQAKASGWGAWYGAKGQGITGFMGIDQSATKAVGALDKLSTSSIDTAKNLSSGLGNLGNSLNQPGAAASGGGGGGLFGWLGSLFGGGTTKYASDILSGARVGLFAEGTENAPPGWAWVGERGPELMRMRGGEVVRNNQKSIQMAANGNSAGPHVVVPTVRMYIDQDDKWTSRVEEIAQGPAEQQSSKAVGSYAYQQRQGGAARDDHYYQRLKRRN